MRLALRLLVCCLCLATAAAVPAAAKKKKPPKPPSRTTVKHLLKAHYLGDDPKLYPTTHYHFKVTKIVYGKRRHGTYYADGHSGTVFPVLARSSYLVCYPDGTYWREKTIRGKYVFFRDDFHEWTFRIKDEHRPVTHFVKGKCPKF